MHSFLDHIPLDRVCGLSPEIWLCVGSGYAREDVKSLLLSQGRGFVRDAIGTLPELCLKIMGIAGDRFLGTFSRQEVLRVLVSEPRILAGMPELKRMRRQKNFLKRLDLAIQMGRMAFAHSEEEEVFEERLRQACGPNLLRTELRGFTFAYEAWLEASGWMDLPLLMRCALKSLENGWPARVSKPQEVWILSIQTPESLEREFWDVLGREVTVRSCSGFNSELSFSHSIPAKIEWQMWHTLDHAAEFLADELMDFNPNDHAILIPDVPMMRRSLRRVLESRGIPLADPRDPTRLRWDESIKWALLPLEVIGLNFERRRVISWLHGYPHSKEFSDWVIEINGRGIRNGLASYSGGLLASAHSLLYALNQELGGRKTCEEISRSHLKILKEQIGADSRRYWINSFFEGLWSAFVEDIARVGQENKKAPALFWLERLQGRLNEASPPIDPLKPLGGIQIFRLQQAPLRPIKKVWILGMPALWLDGKGSGSYWFNEREKELLAMEFAVRSAAQIRDERLKILKSWISGAEKVFFLDCQYDVDGRERESIVPILKELQLITPDAFPEFPQEKGAHPRFLKSYSVFRPIQPQEVLLSEPRQLAGKRWNELSATAVDRYSRCPFQALAYHRWGLKDIREPDSELWPEMRGNLLHEAVRLLMRSLDGNRQFTLSPREALERAWLTRRPKGLIRSRRIEAYVQSRLCFVLGVFCEKEREYLERAQTEPISLDSKHFQLQYPELSPAFSIVGQPDRVDAHAEGLFIIDYKTSGTVPHGVDLVERGYRLQLPFYALAVRNQTGKSILGCQFIELDRKGSRKSGIFFPSYNGKELGKLTQVRSNSKSLIPLSPEEVWNSLEEKIIQSAQGFLRGQFDARPNVEKKEKECARCAVSDLCGFRRQISDAC